MSNQNRHQLSRFDRQATRRIACGENLASPVHTGPRKRWVTERGGAALGGPCTQCPAWGLVAGPAAPCGEAGSGRAGGPVGLARLTQLSTMHGRAREGGRAGPGSRGTHRAGARSEKQVRSRGRHAQRAGREAHIMPGLRAALNTAEPCKHGGAVLGGTAQRGMGAMPGWGSEHESIDRCTDHNVRG